MNLIVTFVGNLDCLDMFASSHAYISVPEETKARRVTSAYTDIMTYETGLVEITFYDIYQVESDYTRHPLPESFFNRNDINFLTLTSDELEDCDVEAIPIYAAFEDLENRTKIALNMPDLNEYLDARFVVHPAYGISADKFIEMVSDVNTSEDTLLQFPLAIDETKAVSGYVKNKAFTHFEYYDLPTVLKELVHYVAMNPEEKNVYDIYPYFFTEGEFVLAKITFE